MEGGRFLGAGSYGCVFTPPLLCQGDKKQRFGKTGKVTLDIFADQEIHVANRIRKVPMAKHYFILPEPESCQPAPEEEQTDPGIEECRVTMDRFGIKLDDMEQIFEPFGGNKNLFYIFESKDIYTKQFSFMKTMRHFLEAGSILHLSGVVHFDIHPGNIVYDKNMNFRILDYGNAIVLSELTETLVNMHWKRLRFGFEPDAAHHAIVNADPPEYTIMDAIHKNQFSVEDAVKLTVHGKPVFRNMNKILGVSMKSSYDSLIEFCKTSEAMKQHNFIKIWKSYWPVFDSWAIANILFEMLQMLLYYKPFTEGDFKIHKTKILATLRAMLEPNPRKRLDCIQALALFDPGNPWLNRFGQKWLQARQQQKK